MTNVDQRHEELSRIGQEALRRLIDKVEGCDVEVCKEVAEGAGHPIAAIACQIHGDLGLAVTMLLADVIKLTYRAGYLHGKSHQVRETN